MSRNFGHEFLTEISTFGTETALIWRDQEISFENFQKLVGKWKNIIEKQKKNYLNTLRIALFCSNSPDILSIIIASQLSGITVIPLNPSFKKYEIDKYIAESNANFLIVSDDVDCEKFEEIEFHTISELLSAEDNCVDIDESPASSHSGAIVFFSSGTTGPPKLFEYSQKILCSQIDQLREIQLDSRFFSPSKTDICYGVLPFFHAGGLITVFSMIFSGCTILINERWNEQEFLSNCQKYRVSVLFLVPPVLNFFANHPLISNFDLSSLKTIYVGAAASPPENFRKVSERLPKLENLIQLYGTTECGVLLCSTGKGDLGCLSYKLKELMLIGRMKEIMKVRGWQVNPNEIENVIRKVKNVIDCAVYQSTIPDKLIAKVIGNPGTKNEIISVVKENLASYKQLDDVIFVSELPKNSSGKLMRHLLQRDI
ncbi:hypothetical protein GCK72_002176 [Caenorhabditis remanei]|uniref:AMP-dependent synthetase/ligase domain-containing protein n=1 Tax=Caenorhabditis remanei TaxID=31234 RepID=A0A6A5HR11_CAERE|nr:hypothetical protein GCK72_002176 [Caenorhabditis remanei]KAF1770358.1 hypothetical protein GCK72_002176 [Caenorhabditis remanei]